MEQFVSYGVTRFADADTPNIHDAPDENKAQRGTPSSIEGMGSISPALDTELLPPEQEIDSGYGLPQPPTTTAASKVATSLSGQLNEGYSSPIGKAIF